MKRLASLAACLCLLVLSCHYDRTQIVLITDTDMTQGPGRQLTHVRVQVNPAGSTQTRLDRYFTLGVNADAGESLLPSTLGITALDNDGRRTVSIRVTAIQAVAGREQDPQRELYTARAIVPFQQGRTLALPVFLYSECINVRCDEDQTCQRGVCVSARQMGVAIDPGSALDASAFRPPPQDAASDTSAPDDLPDAPMDVAVHDILPPVDAADAGVIDVPVDVTVPMDALCPAGVARCDEACVDTSRDTRHCGGCRNACPQPANGAPTCSGGMCGVACTAGFGDCDGDRTNGCESNLQSAVTHCGTCGRTCALANAASGCAGGECAVATCNAGFADCNRVATDGCEANVNTSNDHCGACARACSPANAAGACRNGTCTVDRCDAGFADCDRDPATGCEVETRTNPSHCGGCGNRCMTGYVCSNSTCVTSCPAGTTLCGASCVNTATDVAHCGGCGIVCNLPNATPVCAMGACRVAACATGFGDCDANPGNGCETALASNNAHCGRCNNACPAGTMCSGTTCSTGCGPGQTLCFGACVDTSSDPFHCGSCGRLCASYLNSQATCQRGTCGIRCNAGFANCNGVDLDGCETSTDTDTFNCGACGRRCSIPNAMPVCVGGACDIGVCSPGFADCNMEQRDGCEVSTAVDPTNCGACGNRCAPLESCVGGICSSLGLGDGGVITLDGSLSPSRDGGRVVVPDGGLQL